MAGKFRKNSLTGKMVRRLLNGLFTGIFLFVLMYFGGSYMLRQYFMRTGYLSNAEKSRADEFQSYVTEKKLKTTDVKAYKNWVKEKNIAELMIFRNELLVFDASYERDFLPGAIEIDVPKFYDLFRITFEDGEGSIYVYEGAGENLYNILLLCSILFGFASCLGIFISGMQEDIRYIQQLEKEIGVIGRGNWQEQVTVRGDDELAWLASGLDGMRLMLIEKARMERELRSAQNRLVLSMAHDLRTPLTGLMTYMEILKKQEEEGKEGLEYIDKAYNKVLQIKTLSDEMFEFFFIETHEKMEFEPPEELVSIFGDYLSELCVLLEADGFSVNAEGVDWQPVLIQINLDYIGRITNNMLSNIGKYGDRNQPVRIEILYEERRVGIVVENRIALADEHAEGTGIGMKNIAMMMEQMQGSLEVYTKDQIYRITLYFPIKNF